jgi:hypothetical protein
MDSPRITVRRIIAATAAQACFDPEDILALPSLRAGGVMAVRQRAVMLARHWRPDRSWPALEREFRRNHGTLYEASGAAATRYLAGDPEEVGAVQDIAEALGLEVGKIDLKAPRRRHLLRRLIAARSDVARLERQIAALEEGS